MRKQHIFEDRPSFSNCYYEISNSTVANFVGCVYKRLLLVCKRALQVSCDTTAVTTARSTLIGEHGESLKKFWTISSFVTDWPCRRLTVRTSARILHAHPRIALPWEVALWHRVYQWTDRPQARVVSPVEYPLLPFRRFCHDPRNRQVRRQDLKNRVYPSLHPKEAWASFLPTLRMFRWRDFIRIIGLWQPALLREQPVMLYKKVSLRR